MKSQTDTEAETEEQAEPEKPFLKNMLLVIAIVMVVGLAILFATGKMSFRDIFEGIGKMNRRVLSMTLLPLLLAVVVFGRYWSKRKEERMWKEAILKSRARNEELAARRKEQAARKASGEVQQGQN